MTVAVLSPSHADWSAYAVLSRTSHVSIQNAMQLFQNSGRQSSVSDVLLTIKSSDGRLIKLTLNISMPGMEFRRRVAIELGISPERASDMRLTFTDSESRQTITSESETDDMNMFSALLSSRVSTSRATLLVENCENLSSKSAFDVVKILKHLLSSSLRSRRIVRVALAKLETIASEVSALSPSQQLPHILAETIEPVFAAIPRGCELLSKLGLRLLKTRAAASHGRPNHSNCSCRYTLSSNADRRTFRVVLAMLEAHSNPATIPLPLPSSLAHIDQVHADTRFAADFQNEIIRSSQNRLNRTRYVASSASASFRRPAVSSRRSVGPRQRRAIFEEEIPGVDNRIMAQLPEQILTQRDAELIPEAERECQICLEPFQAGNNLLRLPCMHAYHSACIREWLTSSKQCPRDRIIVKLHHHHHNHE